MARPIHPITLPATLTSAGIRNGKLPDSLLVSIDSHGGRLHERAARSWVALAHDLWLDTGIVIDAWGYDSYRPYEIQERIFLARYTTNAAFAARPFQAKTWRNELWYKLPGVATAATPGMSNHGLGLAADINYDTPGLMEWLVPRAADYGWSWELDSEPWHIHFYLGDAIPPALAQYAPLPPISLPITITQPEDDVQFVKATYTNIDGSAGFDIYAIQYSPLDNALVAVHVPGAQWDVLDETYSDKLIVVPEAMLIAGYRRVGKD